MPSKYALDTNVLIAAFRDAAANEALQRFRTAYAPFEHLSVVVVQELRTGATTPQAARALQRNVFEPFERRGRTFAPSSEAWKAAGRALAGLMAERGVDSATMKKTLINDALLAASCREAGVMLVTRNVRDFERIAEHIPFRFAAPGPRSGGRGAGRSNAMA